MTADSDDSVKSEELIWEILVSSDFSGTIDDLEERLKNKKVDYSEEELILILEDLHNKDKIEVLDPVGVNTENWGKVLAFRKIYVPAHIKAQERERKS
jgi:hypothetical protein